MKRSARAAPAAAHAHRREALARSLTGRFWLRFHAALIVAGTFATGALANFALLSLGFHPVLPRWLAAIALGYAGFFLLVRFWLAYVGVRRIDVDLGSADASAPADASDALRPDFRWGGGGGRFGGAGASGEFAAPRALPVANLGIAPASSSSPASALGEGVGGLVDGVELDDALPIVLGLIVLALVAALVGSAVAFVWMAPELLTDTAFAALLASGALPGLARAEARDWHGTLLAATWKPLAAVVVVASGAALALMHWFPGARTLGEALMALR